jgi:N utilization substance protein B
MARRKARELAFQTLFQAQRGDHPLWEVWHDVRVDAAEQMEDDDAVYGDPLDHESLEFAQQLLKQFDDHHEEVDEVLSSSLKGWTFSQMSQTDVTILRLAVSEWRFLPDIPAEVTIDVAVRIAKKFGGEESGRFVNGVLARLINADDVTDDAADMAVVGASNTLTSTVTSNADLDAKDLDTKDLDTKDLDTKDLDTIDTKDIDSKEMTQTANGDAAVLS